MNNICEIKEDCLIFANKEDIKEISNLWLQMVNEMAPEYSPRIDWWVDMAVRLMDSGVYKALIYKHSDKIVGFMDGFFFNEPSTGKLHAVGQHLYIIPEFRNTKAIRLLYKTAIKYAKANNAESLEFFCFHSDIDKWSKRGYKPVRALMRREMNNV